MPCIWGNHNNSQIFLEVAVFPVDFDRQTAPVKQQPGIFKALLDTGAQSTCITSDVAGKVGLEPIGKVPVSSVSGIQYHNNYLFKIGFPHHVPVSDGNKVLSTAGGYILKFIF